MIYTMEFFQSRRPSIQQTLMQSANLWAMRSTCDRSQVGVVIASEDHRILVTGYNGTPKGMSHCSHECTCDYEAMRQKSIVTGTFFVSTGHKGGCHALRPCETAVHAEANAIAYAARCGIRVGDATLYTTLAPCHKCAQLVINAGIVQVIYLNDYRDTAGLELLSTAGVDVIRYSS